MSSPASATIPPPAAIYESDTPSQDTEVSDVSIDNDDDDTSDDEDKDEGSGDNGSDGEETEDAAFHRAAREIMNRAARRVGTAAMKDRRFRSFFGAQFEIVRMVRDMLGEGGLRPKKSESKHLLWKLYFLKVYPREGPGCAAVGGSRGAVDPKTMRKCVWLFFERIAELADEVVRSSLYRCLARHHL
jgi:hypothetical protein